MARGARTRTANIQAVNVTPVAAAASYPPTRVASGATFSVPADQQVLFSEEIELDGALEIDGVLTEVD